MDTIITAHNKRTISQDTAPKPECNCNRKGNFPLRGKCQKTAIVTEEANNETKKHIGITGGTFKQRDNDHKKSFKREK